MTISKNIILLSTAEWDNPFWTNKQHVAVEMAELGNRVLYIDSQGIRKASVKKQDVGRIFKRLRKAFAPPRKVRDNIYVWSPVPLPLRRFKLIEKLNRWIFEMRLQWYSKKLKLDKPLLWSYSPLTPQYIKHFDRYSNVIYHCVDEIKAQPGMPVSQLEQDEKSFLKHVDIVFVTSKKLLETRKELHNNVIYYSNVVDYRHFAQALDTTTAIPDDLQAIMQHGPVVGFIGAISGYKVDFNLLNKLSSKLPEVQFVLIGKVGEGDPWTNVNKLKDCRNIHFLGARSYSDLPAYLKGFKVAILPCCINEYTESMFPMKFFEYLASGTPVVSTPLPAIAEFADVAALVEDDSFIDAVRDAVTADNSAQIKRGVDLAAQYTYKNRMGKMIDDINAFESGKK